MKATMLRFSRTLQTFHFSTFLDSEKLQIVSRNKCQRAMEVIADFLGSFIPAAGSDKNCEQSTTGSLQPIRPICDSCITVPSVEIRTNSLSVAERKKGNPGRKAETLPAESEHTKHEKRGIFRYSEVRDIRPPHLKTPHSFHRFGLYSCGFRKRKRRDRKILSAGGGRSTRHRSQSSSQDIDFDMYYIARSRRRKQAFQPILQDPMVKRALFDLGSFARADPQVNSRRCNEPEKIDRADDEHDRQSKPPVCQKRKRVVSNESILEEPEHKLRRMAE